MWKEASDNGLKVHVGVLFIDFRKAFECVNHIILGEKLKTLVVDKDDGLFSKEKSVGTNGWRIFKI